MKFLHPQVTANNAISLAQFDYAVKFEEEYREAIASGIGSPCPLSLLGTDLCSLPRRVPRSDHDDSAGEED